MSPANVERERCFESERYCERKREIEIFKMSRTYEEFMERLGVEMIYNNKYSKYLPSNKTEVVGDKGNNDFINYLIMTNNTGGDRTMTNHDRLNEFAEDDENLNCICVYDCLLYTSRCV